MSIDLSNFRPKDAKIISENEGKEPYDLLELGLSQKAYERLISGDYKQLKETEAKAEVQKDISKNTEIKPEIKPMQESKSNIVQPASIKEVPTSKTKLTAPNVYKAQKAASNVGSVSVYNKRTGRTTKMSVSAANRLTKQPNIYQILR